MISASLHAEFNTILLIGLSQFLFDLLVILVFTNLLTFSG